MSRSGSSERRRVAVCAVCGVASGAVAALVTVWQLAVLLGWVVTASVLLVWIWGEIGRRAC